MVFTALQTTAFFENAAQMGLTNRTRLQSLLPEGIAFVADLAEWEDDDWDQWYANCRRPPKIQDPANVDALIDVLPFPVPVKSLKRLKLASRLVRFYQSVDRDLTAANMRWEVIKNFDEQKKALDEKAKETVPEL